jgi:transcriptional regulator with GAF, ATPase, and Fis domain
MSARVDSEALGASLRRLAQHHQDATVLETSLWELLAACNSIFRLRGSGVMLADEHGELRYAVASDRTSQLLEDAQLATGEGPCVDTFVRAEMVSCSDVRNDPRWPALGSRLVGQPVRAVLGVPIRLASVTVGSLDVYREQEHEWDDSERNALSRYGAVAGQMLVAAVSAERSGVLADQLTYAVHHRAPIERGVGYLMARDGIGQVESFNRLRTAARCSRRAMGDVADALLRTGRLPAEDR